jgi:hypothetical protein
MTVLITGNSILKGGGHRAAQPTHIHPDRLLFNQMTSRANAFGAIKERWAGPSKCELQEPPAGFLHLCLLCWL